MTEPNRPFRRRVMLNTAATGLGNAWAMVVSLVSLPLLLHGLGAEGFGTWVLLQTFSAITGWISLADLGAGTATTRLVAERASVDDEAGTRTGIGSSMSLFIAFGLIGGAAVAGLGVVFFPSLFNTPDSLVHGLRVATVFFGLQVFIDLVTEGTEACLEGLQRVDVSRAIDAIRRSAVAIATCVAANTAGSLESVAVASCLASTVGVVSGFAALRRFGGPFARPSTSDIRGLLHYGRTVAVLRPLGVLHRTMDRVIVGSVIGPEAVALVEIATQVQTGADSVLSASSYAVVPSASWLQARGDRQSVRELLEVGTKYSMLVTSAFVVAGMVFARPFVHLWVGDTYRDAAGLTVVALLFVGVTAPIQVGSNLLLGIGRAGDILRAALAAVVVNLIASLVLVHAVGIVGCFIGSLVGTALLLPILGRAALASTGTDAATFVRRSIVPSFWPAAALAAVGGLVEALPLGDVVTLAVGVPAGLAAFAFVALRWSVSREEIAAMRQSFARE